MLTIKYHASFKRDYKRAKKRGCDMRLLEQVLSLLSEGKTLPPKYREHALGGGYDGCMECHITPDWLLIYEVSSDDLILYLLRTGSHSDLFG